MSSMAVHFSSATDQHPTPQDFFDRLNARYRFTLDVCALPSNAKCARFFTPEVDGLKQSWAGERVWCNPPYGRGIRAWIERCHDTTLRNPLLPGYVKWAPELAVMLLPARTDTAWFHELIWDRQTECPLPGVRVDFLRGRLKFGSATASAPFPSMLVEFRSL